MGNFELHIGPAEPAAAELDEAQRKVVLDRYVEFHAKIYGAAQAYDTVVILAGYGAFFGLLSSAGQSVTVPARLLSVGLMTTSLMLYMAWHIVQMLTRQKYEWKRAGPLQRAAEDFDGFISAWNEIDRKLDAANLTLLSWWRVIFWPCVATGFAGAGVLGWNALTAALDLPLQLVGWGH